jgi:hypothetical protein
MLDQGISFQILKVSANCLGANLQMLCQSLGRGLTLLQEKSQNVFFCRRLLDGSHRL